MKLINKYFKTGVALMAGAVLLQSCNKELPLAQPIEEPSSPGTETIWQKLQAAEFSLLKAGLEKAATFNSTTGKIIDILDNPTGEVTFFAPDNTAILTSFGMLGLPANPSSLDFFRAGQLDSLFKYHIIGGQEYTTAKVNYAAPNSNMYLQSSLVLAPPSAALPPGLRMPIFLGKQGTANFVNYIPVTAANIAASNGVMHKTAIALLPPDQVLWQRIATNPDYSYFRNAVLKADQGDAAKTLESALSNPAANLTVFVPTNTAFQQLLYAQFYPNVRLVVRQNVIETIKAGIMLANPLMTEPEALAQATYAADNDPTYIAAINSNTDAQTTAMVGTPDVINNPALTQETIKGLVVYHILGNRKYTVNMPTTQANFPTMLNSAIAAHPGVGLQVTLGATGATAATVKGAANPTAANVVIGLSVNGTSDQNFINGVIHRIDQVLRPQ